LKKTCFRKWCLNKCIKNVFIYFIYFLFHFAVHVKKPLAIGYYRRPSLKIVFYPIPNLYKMHVIKCQEFSAIRI
jgi:hypothetical protein